MKKIGLGICIGLCCLSLTGCIDIVQHITRKSDGTDQNTISLTIAKAMLEMAASMQGNSSVNYDELFTEFNASDMKEYEQFGAKITKINDQVNVGYLIDMNINYKDKDILKAINAEDIDFIPKYTKKKMTIYVGSLQDDDSSQTGNEMAQLFLATSKYRLLISKSCMPSISKVILKESKKSTEISYLDLYDEYLIEIPIMRLLKNKITVEIHQ
ncbi:hypothetical protein C5N99_05900 [Treponema medium]|uniref:Lipoprotein n=2 Tax=Treponema medium TaxID=58231 RepID=A0AA87NLY6_TREMD|nr:hypothetical protein [Treponema medium]EPF28913.1 hypothetical protein HMPREF9195_01154 [Treponema medium ATCC 700293]QSH92141.1 hypothetical protein C5N99_05900 [Treponema medium]QSH97278.1 hypothetical protein DWB79_05850 [Treponema medium]